jgi:nucleoid-associated protein YgaU
MRTLNVAGGNLFQIAAQQLGDATQWVRIAALNGLSDPMILGVKVLKLPPTNARATGGVVAR